LNQTARLCINLRFLKDFILCDLPKYVDLKEPLPHIFLHDTSKRGPYISHMLQKKFTCRNKFNYLILSGNLFLRKNPFRNVNCLKSFDFALFFVYTLKLLKNPAWHNSLLYFEKIMSGFRAY